MKLCEIPKSIDVFLDSEEISKMEEIIDEFFNNTKAYLESVHDSSVPHEFRIRTAGFDYSGTESNDRATYLFYDDRYVVAGVIRTRNMFNNVRHTFFRNLDFLDDWDHITYIAEYKIL